MGIKKRKTPIEKEWELLLKKEAKLYKSKQEKKDSKVNQLLAEKVPEKLQQTLDTAFYKAFLMIFEKGTKVIEKTYEKKEMETIYKVQEYEEDLRRNKKALKAFSKQANSKGTENVLLSGISGIGMGILGIGLPDIPIFTGMLFRSIYEIALSYGYEYESEQEQYFILLLIQGAAAYGEEFFEIEENVNCFINEPYAPRGYERAEHAKVAAGGLSKELLYMKFLQGIPVVGAVGGAYDVIYMNRVTEYAKLKYGRRFLEQKRLSRESL